MTWSRRTRWHRGRASVHAARAVALLLPLVLGACEELPNVPPVAAFIYTPVSPIIAGQTTVIFNATGSADSDGRVSEYVWNFGDGTAEQRVSSASTTHVFPDTPARCLEITYTVLLTVIDDRSATASASERVTVIELPRPGSPECLAGNP